MIRTQKYTPEVYYEQSRDFQFIGRLYDVVLNSVKTNVDIIQNSLPFNTRSSRDLLKLMSYTLGFKPKHKYSHAQLLAICSVFSELLRNKGNVQSIYLLGETILKTEGIVGNIACLMQYDVKTNKNLPTLRIIIPEQLAEIALFYDLLEYIAPVGCKIEIIRGTLLDPIEASTPISIEDEVIVLRELDGNLIPRDFAVTVPSGYVNPIISGVYNGTLDSTTNTLNRHHIANNIVWRRGSTHRPNGGNK